MASPVAVPLPLAEFADLSARVRPEAASRASFVILWDQVRDVVRSRCDLYPIDVGIRLLRRLLQIRRQGEERQILIAVGINGHHYRGVPSNDFLDQWQIPQHDEHDQVDDDRNPRRFPPSRALQIILNWISRCGT